MGALKVAVLGYGRAGKDTVGGWLGLFTSLKYVGSTSRVICPMIAKELGITPEEAWADRHNNRMFWYEWANKYREGDPSKIARACLQDGDIVVGLRDIKELEACKAAKLFDLTVWVENERVPKDITVTFTKDDCDVVIVNNSSYQTLYDRLSTLCRFGCIIVSKAAVGFDKPTVDANGDWIGPLSRLQGAKVLAKPEYPVQQ